MIPLVHRFSNVPALVRLSLFLAVCINFNPGVAQAQIFNYGTLTSGVGVSAAHTSATALTRGVPSILASPDCITNQGFGSHGWPATNTFHVDTFNNHGWYVEVTISAASGYSLNVTGFSTRSRRENFTGTVNDGPLALRYGYSKDGGAWTAVNPGSPLASNVCASNGIFHDWPSVAFPIPVDNSITFRVYGLSSGDGDLFLRDLIVNGDVCADVPTVTLDFMESDLSLCEGETDATLAFSEEDADAYTIDFTDAAFTDVSVTELNYAPETPGTIALVIPGDAAPGIYEGNVLTVTNICGFKTQYFFDIVVNAPPTATIIGETQVCEGASTTLDASGDGTYLWSDLSTGESLTVSPTVTTTYTLTVTSAAGCIGTDTHTVSVIDITATADAGADQMTCVTGSVQVAGVFGGTATSGSWSDGAAGGSFAITSLPNTSPVTAFYTPPPVHGSSITLTFTTDDNCPASDDLVVTYGTLPPLTLTTIGGASSVTCGDTITVWVEATNGFTNLSNFQFSLNWDETKLEYISDSLTSIGGVLPGVGTMSVDTGALTYAWIDSGDFDGESLPNGTSLWKITMKVIGNSGIASVSIIGSPTGIEAYNNQFCELTVNTLNDVEIELSPISVTCPNGTTVCLNALPFTLAGEEPTGGEYSGAGVSGGIFNPADAEAGTHTITYTYTAPSGCSNSCEFDITVNALPDVSLSAVPAAICLGGDFQTTFSGEEGAFYSFTGEFSDINTTDSIIGPLVVSDGDYLDLTEGIDFNGDFTLNNIVVTEISTGCSTSIPNVTVDVLPAPVFGFTATVTGRTPQSGSNANGPATINLDFCEGEFFCFGDFLPNAINIGFIEHISDGTQNNYYGASHIDIPRNPTSISAAAAAEFFNGCDLPVPVFYGPYNIDPGTYGKIVQVFTPYLDVNNNGAYDSETDCLGDSITLIYNIYAPPTGSADPNPQTICSGDETSIHLDSDLSGTTFSWTVALTSGDVEGQDDGNGFDIEQTLTGSGTVTYSVIPTGTEPNFCTGAPFDVVVNVNPPVLAIISASDYLICKGQDVILTFSETGEYDENTEFEITATVTDSFGVPSNITVTDVYDGGTLTLTEGEDFTGTLVISNIVVTNVGNGCFGSVGNITIGVNPAFTVDISGQDTVHVGSSITVVGTDNITLPAFIDAISWTSNNTMIATVDPVGLLLDSASVTGVAPGTTYISYTVTDNAGCVNTATHTVTVIDALVLTSNIVDEGKVACGDLIKVQVAVSNFVDILGLFYSINWDPAAFEFVGYDAAMLANFPDVEIIDSSEIGNLDYVWIGGAPVGLPNGTVIFCYTLRAKTSSGVHDITVSEEVASNDSESEITVESNDLHVEMFPLAIFVDSPVDICPGDATAILHVSDAFGSPNNYSLQFDDPAFTDVSNQPLVLINGSADITINLPVMLAPGSYTGTITVAYENSCSSEAYEFEIIMDTMPPMVTIVPKTYACMDDVLAPGEDIQFIGSDNCTELGDLNIDFIVEGDNEGLGCPGEEFVITRTYLVTDEAGNGTEVIQIITVVDDVAPTWTTVSTTLNATVECDNAAGLASAQGMFPIADDNCDDDVSDIVKTEGAFIPDQDCPNAGTYTNTWVVTDDCGNTSTVYTQIITIQDTQVPTWETEAEELDVTLQCDDEAGLLAAQDNAPEAIDNCSDVEPVKVTGVFVPNVDCPYTGTYTNTWTAIDDCDNSSVIFTQIITIIDDEDPSWETPEFTLNAEVECGDQTGLDAALELTPEAIDNCDQNVIISVPTSVDVPSADCAVDHYVSKTTRTWTATDHCGNTSTVYTQVITIVDTHAPEWATEAGDLDVIVQCSDAVALAAAQAMEPEASDCSDFDLDKVSGPFVAGSTCSQSGTYTNTWIATDACGNISEVYTQVITVEDTEDPTWITQAGTLDATFECDDLGGLANAQGLAPEASDNCDNDVSNIVKTEGIFIADIDCPMAGTYTNTWVVTDDCGNTSEVFTQVITIQDSNAPTWVTLPGVLNTTVQCNDESGLAAAQANEPEATDNCSDFELVKVSGDFVPSQNCPQAGTYTNTWTAVDDCGNVSDVFEQIITIIDDQAPTWVTLPGDLTAEVECGDQEDLIAALELKPEAIDNCDEDVILSVPTYDEVPSVDCLADGFSSKITRTWIATDHCSNSSTVYTQVITVKDTQAPTWSTPATELNISVECSDAAGLIAAQAMVPVATDLCDADVSNIVKISGNFIAGGFCANEGSYTNTWTVTDDCGNTSSVFTQVISITDDTAPTWITAATALNTSVECSDAAGLSAAQAMAPTASDLCDSDVSNVQKTAGPFVPGGLCAAEGTYTNTWTVTDDCGNTSTSFTQVITITDNTPPTWVTSDQALNTSVSCSDVAALNAAQALYPTASDLCDVDVSNVVKTAGPFVPGLLCAASGTYTNTWTVTDDCGNVSTTFVQVIQVIDNNPPTWSTAPGAINASVECSDAAGLVAAQAMFPVASDLCDVDVSNIVKTSGAFVGGGQCVAEGTYTNTWVVTDDCGNTSSSFTQVITITDNTAPTWVTAASALNTSVECSDAAALAAAELLFPVASDLCDADVSNIVKFTGAFVPGGLCANEGTYTNTWYVTDDCGNSSTIFTQVITVTDNMAPTWSTAAGGINATVECSDAAALNAAQALYPVASDLCDANVSNIVKSSGAFVAGGLCPNEGTYTNTWTVTDDCGNTSSSFTQVITVTDNFAPTWVTVAGALNTTVEYGNVSALNAAQAMFPVASDLCDGDVSNIVKTSGAFVGGGFCAEEGTYTNTWVVTDDCGNISTQFTQVITVNDDTPPTITVSASDTLAECTSTLQAHFQAWINNHGGAVAPGAASWSTIPAVPVLSGGCNGGTSVTFVASDNCGNTAVTSASFNYDDNMAPLATNPANITVNCMTDVPLVNPAVVVGETDNCDAMLTVTLFAETFMGTSCSGTFLRTYSVSDDCGNTTFVSQTITVIDNVPPTFTTPADITIQEDASCEFNASVGITGDVTDEQDNCSTGLNATYSDYQTHLVGLHNLFVIYRTWTVTDNCGNSAQSTQIITIQDLIAPTISCPPAVSLPGHIEDNTCVVSVPGIDPLSYGDNCNSVYLGYSFSGATTGSGTGSASGQNFFEGATTVTYTVSDEAGNTSTCSVVVTVNCITISGKIKWIDNPNLGVKDATVRLTPTSPPVSALTDINGDYTLNVAAPGTYSITPVKNINRLNGVTAADAMRIQQHLAGTLLPTGYKKIAADVNRNGSISTQDANLITQSIAGNPTALAVFNVFWRFTPTTYVLPVTAPNVVPTFPEFISQTVTGADIIGKDFFGMKIGDVDGNANPAMAPAGKTLVLVTKDETLHAGSSIEMNLAASNFENLAAIQFALDFDPAYLQFEGFESLDAIPMSADNFGTFDAAFGELRVVWSQAHGVTLSDGTPVLKARFKVLQGGQKLSDVLKLDDSVMPCKAYTELFADSYIRLEFVESVATNNPLDAGKAQLQLFQNHPNPFAGETTIGFVLPAACDAQLRILDVSGRELTNYNRQYTAGYHEIEFRMENAASYGVLYYELITPFGKLTKKMVVTGK